MKLLGTGVALAAATTKLNTAAAAYVVNTATSAIELFQVNSSDATVATVWVGAGAGVTISLGNGQGLRGAATFKASAISSVGY
jgi:hypothetical protein|tara:strand:- start:27077 stop:27325 length:249 start_codon:yes stop_codon:yes gene_type:complete